MKSLFVALSLSLLLAGCQTNEQPKMVTSGICAYLKEHIVVAKVTDDIATKRASAAQIQYYNKHC
jgi:uncharacterized lipoprotein YehR (DUF1307 family)